MTRTRYLIFVLILLCVSRMTYAQSIDFTDRHITDQMWVVNDGVMGGISQSKIRHDTEGVIIEGVVSLENNGGFASARVPAAFDTNISVLELMVKGDGKRYKFILRTDALPRTPMYQAEFVATGDWTRIRFRPDYFKASFRGRAVSAPELSFSDVKEMGVLIADQQAGPFHLQLKYLRAVAGTP